MQIPDLVEIIIITIGKPHFKTCHQRHEDIMLLDCNKQSKLVATVEQHSLHTDSRRVFLRDSAVAESYAVAQPAIVGIRIDRELRTVALHFPNLVFIELCQISHIYIAIKPLPTSERGGLILCVQLNTVEEVSADFVQFPASLGCQDSGVSGDSLGEFP